MMPRPPSTYSIAPRLLSKADAAHYVGVGEAKFDAMVAARLMPSPKIVGERMKWDVRQLDDAVDDLPQRDAAPKENPFDKVFAG